jgi:Ca-activated chloride channel family protein
MATRLRVLIPVSRTVAVGALILALARPQQGDEQTRIFSEGIAIEMVVDVSGSMQAMDFELDGQRKNRLEAIKKVFGEFVSGGKKLEGRPDDLIGMIAFAMYPDSKCPLTLDHDNLLTIVEQTEIDTEQTGSRTAIGDGIALGVERLLDIDRRRKDADRNQVKSKVMILLTDGESNAGEIDPKRAAELAATMDVKIYTVGVGTRGMAPVPVRDFTGRLRFVSQRVNIDEDTLKEIARITGGRYFRATDTSSLENIYAEIDQLEKTETEEKRYLQYREKAPWLLGLAFAMVSLEIGLVNTRFRKIP